MSWNKFPSFGGAGVKREFSMLWHQATFADAQCDRIPAQASSVTFLSPRVLKPFYHQAFHQLSSSLQNAIDNRGSGGGNFNLD
jgi:hypothetical protein